MVLAGSPALFVYFLYGFMLTKASCSKFIRIRNEGPNRHCHIFLNIQPTTIFRVDLTSIKNQAKTVNGWSEHTI